MRQRDVWERVTKRLVVLADGVTEVVRRTDELTLDNLQGDVDDVVSQPASVRETCVVSTDHAEAVGVVARSDRRVQSQHLTWCGEVGGLVEPVDSCEEYRHEVVT